MKIATLSLALAAIVGAGALGAGSALATTSHQTATKTLRIVMHDPGCHWFMRGGKFTKTATVKGRVRLVNLDEDALKVKSHAGTKRIAVGKSIVLGHGKYAITMVKQTPDDNHLKLTVR